MSAHDDVVVLTARLFAPLRVEIDGRPLPEIGVRSRSVLAWLLLNPGQHARAGGGALLARRPRDQRVDVHEFDRLAGSSEPADLERALALARAPLLPGLADDWVLEARDEYRERAAASSSRASSRR